MELIEKEKELMERWKKERAGYDCFNEDGVINYEVWKREKLHILFVLKETNELSGSLSRFLEAEGSSTYWRTWNNIARWTDVLLNHHYSEYISRDFLREMLSHVAVMNLKKQAGGNRATRAEILKYARNDKKLLLEQMRLYQPDIVITCGFNLVSDIVLKEILEEQEEWIKNEKTGLNSYKTKSITYGKSIPIISMPHPNRAAKEWTKKLEEITKWERLY